MKIIINANTDLKRTKGLMHHPPIKKDECALFTMPRCGQHVFWNKNVDFPISLIFCNSDKKVEEILSLSAQQTESIKPKTANILYVVETHIDYPCDENVIKGKKLVIQKDKVHFA